MNLMSPLTSRKFCIFDISANERKVCFLTFSVSVFINSAPSFVSGGHSQEICSAVSIPVLQPQTADGTIPYFAIAV